MSRARSTSTRTAALEPPSTGHQRSCRHPQFVRHRSGVYCVCAAFSTCLSHNNNFCPPPLLLPDGPECDIWSLGVILYILLTGKAMFYGWAGEKRAVNEKEIHRRIRGGIFSFPKHPPVSHDAQALIRWCLTQDPASRPTAEDVLKHKWCTTRQSTKALPEVQANLGALLQRHRFRAAARAAVFALRMRTKADVARTVDGQLEEDMVGPLRVAFQ